MAGCGKPVWAITSCESTCAQAYGYGKRTFTRETVYQAVRKLSLDKSAALLFRAYNVRKIACEALQEHQHATQKRYQQVSVKLRRLPGCPTAAAAQPNIANLSFCTLKALCRALNPRRLESLQPSTADCLHEAFVYAGSTESLSEGLAILILHLTRPRPCQQIVLMQATIYFIYSHEGDDMNLDATSLGAIDKHAATCTERKLLSEGQDRLASVGQLLMHTNHANLMQEGRKEGYAVRR